MTTALVIPFHRYTPFYEDNYRLIYEYFKLEWEKIWKYEVDKLYFIDSQDFLKEGETIDDPQIQVVHTNNYSHADNLEYTLPNVQEDIVGIMDMDTVVYRKDILKSTYDLLKEGGVDVAAYCEKPDNVNISRFAPYFFFVRMELLRKTSLDFKEAPPEHLDPLAKLTHEMLAMGAAYKELFDDRSTIQMQADGTILRTFKPYPGLSGTGSYHLRNFNGGIHMVDSYNCEKEQFHDKLARIPTEEMTRIFGWNWTLNDITMKKQQFYDDVLAILALKGITKEIWLHFIKEFQDFHKWIFI